MFVALYAAIEQRTGQPSRGRKLTSVLFPFPIRADCGFVYHTLNAGA